MRKLTRTTAVFLAAMSVYSSGALAATPANGAGGAAGDVRVLDAAAPVAAPNPSEGTTPDASQMKVSDTGTVDLDIKDANLVEVLRMLSLKTRKNIVASKEVRGTVTASLSNVTVREALDAILKANGYGYREKGNFIYVYSQKELAEIEKAERKMVTEVFRLYYAPAANVQPMIKPALSQDGVVSVSLPPTVGIDSKETGGNSSAVEDTIVVKDFPENMEKVRQIIKEVDRRPQQILIEATILAARLTDDNALGIDFNVIGGVDFSNFVHNGQQIVGAQMPDTSGGDVAAPGRVRSVGSGDNFTKTQNAGFKVGLVTSNVSLFINALEEVTNSVVLANPKVLALNKQKGEVLVGREDGYLTTTVTESTTVQSVQFLQTGTKLSFRPFVGDDGYIRLEVHPEDSDGKVINGLPSKTTTEVTTNVMVRDGQTIVIGGLFREGSTTSRSQIPGVGSIPLIGPLLGSNSVDNTTREEIIVLLTPHIVKDDKAYSAVADKIAKEYDKLRVGIRRGMMPWGRERLSELCYNSAVEEMNKPSPNRKMAMWHLDCAVNLNPTFREALDMKERVSGKELTTVDNATIRNFIKNEILHERGTTPTSSLDFRPSPTSITMSSAQAPASVVITGTPTTRPAQATQAVAVTPVVQTTATAHTAPTTRPVQATASAANAPTTRPSTVLQAATAALDKLLENKSDSTTAAAVPATPAAGPAAGAAKATEPAGSDSPAVKVTELPSDEVIDTGSESGK